MELLILIGIVLFMLSFRLKKPGGKTTNDE